MPDLYDLVDSEGNLISTKKTALDTANPGYSEFVKTPTTQHTDTPLYNERERLGVNTSDIFQGYQSALATNQSGWEQTKNAFKIFGAGLIGGTASAGGASVDIVNTAKMVAGVEKEYSNMIMDWGRDYMQKTQQNNPIYQQQNDNDFHITDPGWWASQFGQQGYSAGIMLEAIGESMIVTALTEGAGIIPELASIAKKIKSIGTLKELMSTLSNSEKIRNTIMLSAAIRGTNEMYMEGMDTFKETKQKFLEQGYSEQDAIKYASVAASETARGNIPKVAMDVLQARLMTINPMSGGREGLLEGLLGKIGNKGLRALTQYGTEMGSEALEEYYQYIVSEEGKHTADVLSGHDDGTTFNERFKAYNEKGEIWNNTFGGALGGLLLGGMQQGIQRMMESSGSKQNKAAQKQFVNSLNGYGLEFSENLKKLESQGKYDTADAMRRIMAQNRALYGLHLDSITDNDSAFSGHLTFLNKALEMAKTNPDQLIAEFGEGTNVEFIKTNFPTYIKDAEKIEELYKANSQIHDQNAVVPITQRQFEVTQLSDMLQDTIAKMELSKNNIPDYVNLSPTGKDILDADIDRHILSDKEKAEVESRLSDLYNSRDDLKEEAEKDYIILDSIPSNTEYAKLRQKRYTIENQLSKLRKELKTWQSKEFQQSNTQQKIDRIINDAETTEELESVRSTMAQEGILNEDNEAKIQAKKDELTIQEYKEELKTSPVSENTTTQSILNTTNEVAEQHQVANSFGKTVNPDNEDMKLLVGKINKIDTATVIDEDSLFDPAKLSENLTDEYKKNLSDTVKGIHDEYQKETGKKPSFEDLMNTIIDFSSKEEAEKNFNAIKLGWELNFGKADFDRIYNKLFSSLKSKVQDLMNIIPKGFDTNEELVEANQQITVNEIISVDETEGGELIPIRNENFKTVTPTLKLAFLSKVKGEEELNENEYVDSKELLDPDKYNRGTKLIVRIPGDVDNILVTKWNETNWTKEKGGQLFSAWNNSNDNSEKRKEIERRRQEELKNIAEPREAVKVETYEAENTNTGEKQLVQIRTTKDGKKEIFVQGEGIQEGRLVWKSLGDKYSEQVSNEILLGFVENPKLLTTQNEQEFLEELKSTFKGKTIREKINAKYDAELAALGQTRTQDEYAGKVPMIVYNKDGKALAFIHDTDWYNPANVGFEDDIKAQQKLIRDAKKELMDFRKAVIANNGSLQITITEKKLGSKVKFTDTDKLISVNEANPQAMIGTFTNAGNILTSKGIIDQANIINSEAIGTNGIGYTYDLRQVGKDENGNPTYYASHVKYNVINQQARESIVNALRVYLMQNNVTDEIKALKAEFQKQTGLDLYDIQDLEKYINLFVMTNKGRANDEKEAYNLIESNPKIANNTPFISTQKGKILFGRKGIKLDGKNDYLYMLPVKAGDTKQISVVISNLEKMYNATLPFMKQNTSKEGISDVKKLSFITFDNKNPKVVPFTSTTGESGYESYLKDNLQTNLKSFNIGTQEEPKYVTFIQPVINFTYDNKKENIISKAAAETVREMTSTEEDLMKELFSDLKSLGVSEKAIKTALENRDDATLFDPNYANYDKITDELVKDVKRRLNTIQDLNSSDKSELIRYISREIERRVDKKNKAVVDKESVFEEIKNSFNNIIAPRKENIDTKLKVANKLLDKFPKYQEIVDELNTIKNNIEIVEQNWDALVREAELEVNKYVGIDTTTDEGPVETYGEKEKEYSKTSLEDNGKDSVSFLLKRFLSQIPEYDSSGDVKRGFIGVPLYPGFDDNYNKVMSVLSSPINVPPSFDLMIQRLQQNESEQPWIRDLINRLQNSSGQIRHAFVSNFARHSLSSKFVMYSFNRKNDNWLLKVYDTNSNEILRVIQSRWMENFKHSPLSLYIDDHYEINKKIAQRLYNQFNSWIDNKKMPNLKEAKEWLAEFGINVSDETMKEIIQKGYYVSEKGKSTLLKYNNMFIKSDTSSGLFGSLARRLEIIINSKESNIDYEENDSFHPLNDSRGIFRKIANIEKKYSVNLTTNSYRDGSKSTFGFTPDKFVAEQVNMLKTSQALRDSKGQLSFDSKSFVLDLLNKDEEFRTKFWLDHLGINSIKELGKKLYRENEITKLSDADYELVPLGLYQDIEQGEVSSKTFNGLDLRMARMLLPTMADKSTMVATYTAVLKLQSKNLMVDENIGLTDKVRDFMFTQLVEPELDRIINHHRRAKQAGVSPNELNNQKAYNKAAQIFHFIPEMNNVKYKGIRLIQFIAESADIIDDTIKAKIIDEVRPAIDKLLEDLVSNEVNKNLDEWNENGYFERDNKGNITKFKFLNDKYIASFKGSFSLNDKAKLIAYDYSINSLISYANQFMLLAGDIANYSQDKAFKKGFVDDKPYLPLNDNIYSNIAENIIGINMGKRLALLIAPGTYLSESVGDKYIQLFLSDRVTFTNNAEYLIELYYGQNALTTEVKNAINTAKTTNDKTVYNKAIEFLSDKFKNLSGYFDIESTDAQEYTTSKEALDILYRTGKLNDEKYKSLTKKIANQRASEAKGEQIKDDDLLTDDEIGLVLQPIKPVYAGQQINPNEDNSRVVYIKSSSFPLLPQITKGKELDKLRRAMEQLEDKSGKNVRASYDTANKVGATKKSIEIWDNQDRFIEGSINPDLLHQQLENGVDTSALILDRQYFRIQQDVPFKSAKRQEDTITLGTQMMKIFFGNNVKNITDKIFEFNGDKVSGRELYDKYNNYFNQWITNEKSKLYDQLGIDERTGQPFDKVETIKKLQDILKEEAIKRNYPLQDIQALDVTPVTDSLGNIKDIQFVIPLWLSPNSNRYESLLNSIVTNRLLKLKLPGNSFVAGSEAGFKLTDSLEGIDQSKIVYTSAYTGELKATEVIDGKITKAQVFVSSKFRNNDGELIDLIKDGYAKQDANGKWMLDEEKIDKDLMSISSFRIPTSDYVSFAQLEIVGFLPYEAGDLMILPKNFTKQKGLDFDVDKENTYWLWHKIEAGRIVPLDKNLDITYDEHSKVLNLINEDIKTLKMQLTANKASKANEVINKQLGELYDYRRDLINSKTKLLQNEIVKIYASILSSPDERIQSKINKLLSINFARDQAKLVQSLTSSKDTTYYTPLSNQYQKEKMKLGAAGKDGIGVYSNYVTFHSLVQQSDYPIQLSTKDDEGKKTNYVLRIGKFLSKGLIGLDETLSGERLVSDVFAERQNTATDNEKEQIMGRVNVNNLTINVDSLLTLMGFDQDTADINGKREKISIPYFLLSQPIIRDYVDEMKNIKSNIATFTDNAKGKVYENLMKKYSTNGLLEEHQLIAYRENLTGQELVNNLTVPNEHTQQSVLNLFYELQNYSDEITKIQSRMNIQRTGLGKSFFEMLEKYDNVSKLAFSSKIDNLDKLIGNFITGDSYLASNKDWMYENGYVDFGDFAVKPTTVTGSLLIHSTKAGYELWSEYFPHQNQIIANEIENIVNLISKETTSEQKTIENKYLIFEEMKKYFYSSSQLGVFNGDPQEQRKRLFFDTEDNKSLASYLNERLIKKDTDLITNNKLIKRFQFALNKDKPSIIKFNNSESEDFNEEYKYQALIELMDNNIKLPDYNGKSYTSRQLAIDLISYAYLEGGIQEAIQFVKYIPIPYLQSIGFSDVTQLWQRAAKGEIFTNKNGETINLFNAMLGTTGSDVPSRFMKQFAQHNAELMEKVIVENMDKIRNAEGKVPKNMQELNSFVIKNNSKVKQFITFYNKDSKAKNKNQLYQWNGQEYQRIPILGTFGMSEYSIKSDNVTPLNDKAFANVDVDRTIKTDNTLDKSKTFKMDEGNLTTTIQEIANSNIIASSVVAKYLLDYIDNTVSFKIGDVFTSTGDRAKGGYNYRTHTITLDRQIISTLSDEQIAQTILEELVHSLTVRQLQNYFDMDGQIKVDPSELPASVLRLHRLLNEVQKHFGEELKEFSDRFSERNVLTKPKDELYYAGNNIFEFVAKIVAKPEIQKGMSEIPYRATDKSLWEQFIETIKSILKEAGINFDKDSVTTQAISEVFKFIDDKKSVVKTQAINNPFGTATIVEDKDLFGGKDFTDPNEDWTSKENDKECPF